MSRYLKSLALCGAFLLGSMKGDVHLVQEKNVIINQNESSLDSIISFNEAVENSDLRQKYLNTLLQEELKKTIEWNSFKELKYIHSFEIENSKLYGVDTSDGIYAPFARTDVKERGVKPVCTVYGFAFDKRFVNTVDELMSLIDNEAYHAHEAFTAKVRLKLKKYNNKQAGMILTNIRKNNPELEHHALELKSFDYQFGKIQVGERKVSENFLKAVKPLYERLFNRFEKLSGTDSWSGHFARLILDSLKVNPEMIKK